MRADRKRGDGTSEKSPDENGKNPPVIVAKVCGAGGGVEKERGRNMAVGQEMLGKAPWSGREAGGDGGKLGSDTHPERWRGGRWKENTASDQTQECMRAVPLQNFSLFSRREVKGVDMLSGGN